MVKARAESIENILHKNKYLVGKVPDELTPIRIKNEFLRLRENLLIRMV